MFFGAYVPDPAGCVAAGETKEVVLALIHEAVEFHTEGLKLDGLTLSVFEPEGIVRP